MMDLLLTANVLAAVAIRGAEICWRPALALLSAAAVAG
jgi:hypothetical protein